MQHHSHLAWQWQCTCQLRPRPPLATLWQGRPGRRQVTTQLSLHICHYTSMSLPVTTSLSSPSPCCHQPEDSPASPPVPRPLVCSVRGEIQWRHLAVLYWFNMSKRGGKDGFFQGWQGWSEGFSEGKARGNSEEQPSQLKENPVLLDSFTQIYIYIEKYKFRFLSNLKKI